MANPGNVVTSPLLKVEWTEHLHFWVDVTGAESEYREEACRGERWSPNSSGRAFPRGCGARRRVLKAVLAAASLPPDLLWELVSE